MSPTEFTHSPVIPIAAPFDLTDYPELAGISGISGTGLVTRIGLGSYATRTLTGTTNQVNVADGNGVAGNPTISLPQNIHTAATPTFAGMTLSGMTSGSILFAGTSGVVSQDNAGLFYDDAANTLRVGASVTTASGGLIQLATGTTAAFGILAGTDTNLYRSAANTWTTDDNFQAVGFITASRYGSGGVASSTVGYNGAYAPSATTGVQFFDTPTIGSTTTSEYVGFGSRPSTAAAVFTLSDLYHFVANQNTKGAGSVVTRQTGFHCEPLTFGTTVYGFRGKIASGSTAWNLYMDGTAKNYIAGTVLLGTTTETASAGRIQLVAGTTAADGILWGTDTNLYRSAANTLKTDDALSVTGNINALGLVIDTGAASALSIKTNAGTEQVRIAHTASANRYITLTGSNGGNPTIGTSAGNLYLSSNTVIGASGISPASYEKLWVSGTDARIRIDNNGGSGGGYYNYSGGTLMGSVAHTGSAFAVTSSGANLTLNGAGGSNQILLQSNAVTQVRIDYTVGANRFITLTGSNGGNPTIDVSAGSLAITPATVFASTITTIGGATFHTTSTALTDGAGAGAGTLTNAPAAGDPTKWIGINDNGTTRYIPAW